MPPVVTLVRPTEELRERLLRILPQAGLVVSSDDVLPPTCSDEQVVVELRQRRSRLLVIPFRQPALAGGRTNGVELLQRLEREAPEVARAPILLPVTMFGAGAARLLLGEANPDETLTRETRHRILVLQEDELDDPKLPSVVRMHVQLHAMRGWPTAAQVG
jgi:hypothetical protein